MIFKDEVRKASKEIGLPEKIYNRQPFPGPGLGIRIVNSLKQWVNEEFLVLDKQDSILDLHEVVQMLKGKI